MLIEPSTSPITDVPIADRVCSLDLLIGGLIKSLVLSEIRSFADESAFSSVSIINFKESFSKV